LLAEMEQLYVVAGANPSSVKVPVSVYCMETVLSPSPSGTQNRE